ncbi:alpha/beta hydrolase [Rhodospirillum sp. A1_3_36]|uniref:alpha/beta hydrolase n=1 Tax=Rhodospirillum sp. A1_3_36 TaxID=3391666 RepID=UPI0039A66A2B
MPHQIINLQNTPHLEGVIQRTVTFDSDGVSLVGTLYTPKQANGPHPGVVVTGAWTTVKEQMAGTYARALAAHGYAALAFDFTGWGESGGAPRCVEDPPQKITDIHAAVTFMAHLVEINDQAVFGLGICASSGYMAEVAADNQSLRKVALVAPWLHNQALAEAVYGGPEAIKSLIAAGAEEAILVGASATDDTSPMYQAPYYTEENRGLIPAWDNAFNTLSWKPWLTYDAQVSADRLTKPLFIVGSPSIAIPACVDAYEARMTAPLERLWLGADVTQFDFYDRADVVKASVDAVSTFFNT